MVNRGDFRADALAGFWRFVAERQAVWYRRVVCGADPPWTTDETLREYRFTNVYRLLDPGTQYAIREILEREESRADRLFNVLLYRLIGRSETHAHVGFQRLDTFRRDAFESALRAREEQGAPVFTGAYVVAGYAGMGGADKIENVARLFATVRDRFEDFHAAVEDASGPAEVYASIRDLPGFGNFLAYQVVVDLLYPLSTYEGEAVLPFSPDEWAAAGPGAKRGLAILTRDGADCSELDLIQWLRREQVAAFGRLSVAFDWLRDDAGRRVELALPDVQNCLCEFGKYHKIEDGTGRARRRFRADGCRTAEALTELYRDAPISVRRGDYDATSVRAE